LEHRGVLKYPLPKWSDEAGVAKLVADELARLARVMARARFGEFDASIPEADKPLLRLKRTEEIAACAARYQGNLTPLAELLRSEPFIEQLLSGVQWLESETRAYLIDVLNGKVKAKRGRPRMTPPQRRAANPIHNAMDEFRQIKWHLSRLYPTQSATTVRDRALEIAAKRAGVMAESLRRHLSRAHNDRRRIG